MKYLLFFLQVLAVFCLCSCKSPEKTIRERSFELRDMFGNKASVTFKEDGTFYGFSGVNRFFGNYKLAGDKISFDKMGSTRMAGPPAAMKFEDKFMQAFNKADRCTFIGNAFTLYKGEIPLVTLKSVE
jgi:heat shock protein HslJ